MRKILLSEEELLDVVSILSEERNAIKHTECDETFTEEKRDKQVMYVSNLILILLSSETTG